jgi:hypothetical protein
MALMINAMIFRPSGGISCLCLATPFFSSGTPDGLVPASYRLDRAGVCPARAFGVGDRENCCRKRQDTAWGPAEQSTAPLQPDRSGLLSLGLGTSPGSVCLCGLPGLPVPQCAR